MINHEVTHSSVYRVREILDMIGETKDSRLSGMGFTAVPRDCSHLAASQPLSSAPLSM